MLPVDARDTKPPSPSNCDIQGRRFVTSWVEWMRRLTFSSLRTTKCLRCCFSLRLGANCGMSTVQFVKTHCTTTHQPSHHHPIAHHHPAIKYIFQDSARLITQSRKTTISSKRKVRTATALGAPSRGDLRESKDSPLPSRVDLGPQRSRLRAMEALPVEHHAQCKMNRDEEQGTFTPWTDAGRHNPKQSQDLVPEPQEPRRRDEPQDCWRSTHPGRNEPQDCRRSRRPNEKNYSPTPPHHLIKRDCLRGIEPSRC